MSSDQHQSDPNGPAPRRGRARVEGAKRTEILAAATERFGRDGYEDTKWADIAADVGVGPTALYHYFESKQHCLYVIMDQAIEDFRSRFELIERRRRRPARGARVGHARTASTSPSTTSMRNRVLVAEQGLLSRPQQLAARGGGPPGRAGANARPRVRLGELPRRSAMRAGDDPRERPAAAHPRDPRPLQQHLAVVPPERDRHAAAASRTFFTDRLPRADRRRARGDASARGWPA